MLTQLLQALDEQKTFSTLDLAHKLNTSPQMVEAMLEHLQRLGVFKPGRSREVTCLGCPLTQACNTCRNQPVKTWQF